MVTCLFMWLNVKEGGNKMNKYLLDEKEYEAMTLCELSNRLGDMLDYLTEGEMTEYEKAKVRALEKIQNYLFKYYD